MRTWLARVLAMVWAGFWLWFAAGWIVHDRVAWQSIKQAMFQPGMMFVPVVLIAWFWPRLGGALLILTGFALSGWYGIYSGHMPTATKLLVLSTIAPPPLVCGLLLLTTR